MRRGIVRGGAVLVSLALVGLGVLTDLQEASAQSAPLLRWTVVGKIPAAVARLQVKAICRDGGGVSMSPVIFEFAKRAPDASDPIAIRKEEALVLPTGASTCSYLIREDAAQPSPSVAFQANLDGVIPTLVGAYDTDGRAVVVSPAAPVGALRILSIAVRYPTVAVSATVPGVNPVSSPEFPMSISCTSVLGEALPMAGSDGTFALRNGETRLFGTDDFRSLQDGSICTVTQTDSVGFTPSGRGATSVTSDGRAVFTAGVATATSVRVVTVLKNLVGVVEITDTPTAPPSTTPPSTTSSSTTSSTTQPPPVTPTTTGLAGDTSGCQARIAGMRPGTASVAAGKKTIARVTIGSDGVVCLTGLDRGTYSVSLVTAAGRRVAYRVAVLSTGTTQTKRIR